MAPRRAVARVSKASGSNAPRRSTKAPSMKAKRVTRATQGVRKLGLKRARSAAKAREDAAAYGKTDFRALTLKCPHLAAAILGQQKRVENRSWVLPRHAEGKWVALHVGGGSNRWTRNHVTEAWDRKVAKRTIFQHWDPTNRKCKHLPETNAIVGFVRFRGFHRVSRAEKSQNPWAIGPYCWEVDRVLRLKTPIRDVPGWLGFWRVKSRLSQKAMGDLSKALKRARIIRAAQSGCRA